MTVSAFVSVMLFGVFKKIRYKLLIHSSVCSWCSGRVHLVSVGLRIIEDSLKSPWPPPPTPQPRILIKYKFTSWVKAQALWDARIQKRWFYSNCLCLILWMYPQKKWKGLQDEAHERVHSCAVAVGDEKCTEDAHVVIKNEKAVWCNLLGWYCLATWVILSTSDLHNPDEEEVLGHKRWWMEGW